MEVLEQAGAAVLITRTIGEAWLAVSDPNFADLVEPADLHDRVTRELDVCVGRLLRAVRSAHVYDTELDTTRAARAAA